MNFHNSLISEFQIIQTKVTAVKIQIVAQMLYIKGSDSSQTCSDTFQTILGHYSEKFQLILRHCSAWVQKVLGYVY